MRDRALLPEAGQFYKANLHCHTVLSDGRWTKEQVKEEYRKRGYSVVAFTDDNHNSYAPGDPRCDAFGGFTMLKLPRLGYAEVIEALRQGNFYASTGPEIHRLEIRGGALEVACSPVEKIYVATSGRRCLMELAAPGRTLSGASFPLRGDEEYVRVECRDASGRRAYSNAYWLDD